MDRIGEITCPAITFHGDVDMGLDIAEALALGEGLGGPSEFVVVQGAGHSSNLEKPEVVNAAMLAFLADLP